MTTLQFQTNLNCARCVSAVKPHLDRDPAVRRWSVDTENPQKILTVEGDGVSVEAVEQHVADAGFKVLSRIQSNEPAHIDSSATEGKSFLTIYRPLLLVLGYLLGVVAVVEINAGQFDLMRAMANFMGGFFVAFSFFKLLDLRGFADAFQTYDIVARPLRAYGFAYPFLELGLGIAYLLRLAPLVTNGITLVVMLLGLIGVTQALLQKRRIQCACLGTVFNLPMSKVTFVEDALMAAMAAAMMFLIFNGSM